MTKFSVLLGDRTAFVIEAENLEAAIEYADIFYPTWIDVRYL